MNMLKTVSTAWRHNFVEREIIEVEFGVLFIKATSKKWFKEFRGVTGVYPSIETFSNYLKEKRMMLKINRTTSHFLETLR